MMKTTKGEIFGLHTNLLPELKDIHPRLNQALGLSKTLEIITLLNDLLLGLKLDATLYLDEEDLLGQFNSTMLKLHPFPLIRLQKQWTILK